MKGPVSLQPSQSKALLDGVRLLSRTFWGPTAETCREILEEPFLEPIEILAPILETDPPDTVDRLRKILIGSFDAESLLQSLETEYVRLFVNDRGGIPTPLYASCYEGGSPRLMGEPAALMKARFESKGLAVDNKIGEPPDHLSIQLEFLYFLLNRVDSGVDPASEAETFVSEAMLPWVVSMNQRLSAQPGDSFYPLASALLVSVLRLISGLQSLR